MHHSIFGSKHQFCPKLTKAKAATIQMTLLIIASRLNSCSVFIVLDSAEGNDRNYDIVLVTAR